MVVGCISCFFIIMKSSMHILCFGSTFKSTQFYSHFVTGWMTLDLAFSYDVQYDNWRPKVLQRQLFISNEMLPLVFSLTFTCLAICARIQNYFTFVGFSIPQCLIKYLISTIYITCSKFVACSVVSWIRNVFIENLIRKWS